VKATSLTALVGFIELTRAGQLVTSTTFQPMTTFSFVALMYLAICLPLSLVSQHLERRLHVGHLLKSVYKSYG
jgi:polar amino acid transport system permease protein